MPPGLPDRRRATSLLVGAAVLVLVALAAVVVVLGGRGSAAPDAVAAEPETSYPDQWDPRIAPIASWVEEERGLTFDHPVEVQLLTEEDYLAGAEADPVGDDEEEAADADAMVAVLRALGLVRGEVDLEAAAGDLAGEGTLAYYSPEEEEVFVRGTEITPGVRATLAHELTHTLQDQHFDLGRVDDPDFERSGGLRAVAEGDAERIQVAYVDDVLSDDDRLAFEEETAAGAEDARAALDETVPPALLTLAAAPYSLGQAFVDHLLVTDGADALDEALDDPPSEEELLFPSIRATVQTEEAEVDLSAPDGAEVIDDDTFGPLALYLVLASRGDPAAALGAVHGWGGDRIVAYQEDDRVCVDLSVVGDDPAATEALRRAVEGWAAQGPEGAASVEPEGAAVRLRSCDPGAAADPGGEVAEDLLTFPLVRIQLETGLRQTGATRTQSDCAAGRLLDAFPLETLTDPAGAQDPAVQGEIAAAVAGCG